MRSPTWKALVYLNAYALDAGETPREIAQRFGGGKVADALRPRPFPQADGTQSTDLYIDPSRFGSVFAADVPALRPRAWPARIVR
jgi:hypothetical protein